MGQHHHFHHSDALFVPVGRAFVALHDLRNGSPTVGASASLEIGVHPSVLVIPPGVVHGFYALSDLPITCLADKYHDPRDELGA